MTGTSVFQGLAHQTPGGQFVQDDGVHPEWGASGIYGLMSVVTPDGKRHLVGTLAKRGLIYDFTDDKVIYDFTSATGGTSPSTGGSGSFGLTGPISNGDTYDASCYWQSPVDKTAGQAGWYYFGGFITGPAQVGLTFSSLNKFTYLLRTRDLVNWDVLIKDQSADGSSWRAEIGDLVPIESVLYVLRADASGAGDQHVGLYSYNGAAPSGGAFTLTRVTTTAAHKGMVIDDNLIYSIRSSSIPGIINLINAATGGQDFRTLPNPFGTTTAYDTVYQGAMAMGGGAGILGTSNGYAYDVYGGRQAFVPCCIYSVDGFGRALGWRGGALSVAGGVVIAANCKDPAGYAVNQGGQWNDNPAAYLLWIGPAGQVKILAVGGHFSGLAVHGDRLYYGVTEHPATNTYSNYLFGTPELASIPIADIPTRVVPASMAFVMDGPTQAYDPAVTTCGVNGWFGGMPTLGYRKGTLRLKSDTAGTLSIGTWSSHMPLGTPTTVTYNAGDEKWVDLSPYLDGGLIGWKFSVAAKIRGVLSMS